MGFDTIEINLVIYIVALMFTHFTNMWMVISSLKSSPKNERNDDDDGIHLEKMFLVILPLISSSRLTS